MMADDKVREIGSAPKQQGPEPVRRCEFPQCWENSDGYAKRFEKHFCNHHRDEMLLCDSYLLQIKDAKEKAEGTGGLLERLQAASSKSQIHYVIDRALFQELKGALMAYQAEIIRLKALVEDDPESA